MERRQRMKQQQQRFCVSQQDLTQAISRMKPHRRATHDNLMSLSSLSLSSCSNETLTVPSVSQLIKDFEARTISTPYVSAQDVLPNDNETTSNEAESSCFHSLSDRTIQIKANEKNDNDQTYEDQSTGDKEQIHQTLNNDRYKRDLPSSSSSSYYSIDSTNNNNNNTKQMLPRKIAPDSTISKRHEKACDAMLAKEIQLNNALADLISLSNDGDISSSMSSSSRSLINPLQRRRASSTTDHTNSISASIALLNNLLETLDLDNENQQRKEEKKDPLDSSSSKNDNGKPVNMFW